MTQVTLWSRQQAVGVPGERPGSELVAVTYSTNLVPPRSVLLPLSAYRQATNEELHANPRLAYYPFSPATQAAELQAIGDDLGKIGRAAPPTLEVP